ncbi:MAG: hypothetical protein HYX69_11345 [Planctomycetia bacterium]|nr:hypothetical protein [Planctomycetia bacterium]
MNAHVQTGVIGFIFLGAVVWLCVTVSGQRSDIERMRQKQAEIDAVHATIAAEMGASADAAYRDVVRKLGR